MKVAELAKEFNTSSDAILTTLKSLKLKAKDNKQDLNSVVISVLRNEFKKGNKLLLSKELVKAPVKEMKIEKPLKPATKSEVEKPSLKDSTGVKTVKTKILKKETSALKTEKPKAKKEVVAAPKPVEQPKVEIKKKILEPQVSKQEPPKPKIQIGKEPIITLKPLARKRKKMGHGGRDDSGFISRDKPSDTRLQGAVPVALAKSSVVVAEKEETETAVVSQIAKPVDMSLPEIEIKLPVSVKDFSVKIGQKPSIVLKHLMKIGILAHINQSLDAEIISALTKEFGFRMAKVRTQEEQLIEDHKKEEEDPRLLKPRAPVVTFMGHVDHGKTSLLDRIRKSKIADSEHGGITQHIGAYSVKVPKGRITFLDTPGHEAFTAMRARGAHITDIVVLVVAADEGVMPQTLEAIDHAKAADLPIVVALNKIDHRNANPDVVKKQLNELGLIPEDWGGKTIVAGVSALTGQGVDNLLEMILLEAELLELKANDQKRASGIVVDAHLSKGKGAVTTLIVQSGTLREGDIIVVGPYHGRVKVIFDDLNNAIKEAGPSMPVEILGLSDVPEAGEEFYVVTDEKRAKEITTQRREQLKNEKFLSMHKLTLEDLYSQIQKGAIKELNVIIKADVQGSLEALKDSLSKIPNDKIKMKFIHTGIGDINASDVLLAVASSAIIIAFHVGIDVRAKQELEKKPVDVREYRIIYDAVNDMKNALEGLLEAKKRKKFLSRIEIRQVFKLSKSGIVAGCYVLKGRVHRKANADILRNNEVIYTGQISSLKRFKDDVRDVNEGTECGITVSGFDKFEPGDMIEAYEIESVAQKL